MRSKFAALALLLAVFLPHQALAAACAQGSVTCNTDTISDAQIATAIRDPTVQLRVLYQYLAFCYTNIWTKPITTVGSPLPYTYCNQIMAGGVDPQKLVAAIMNSTITGEVVSATCPAFPAPTPQSPGILGTAAGCMVDIDVANTVAGLLGVTITAGTANATGAINSTQLTLASVTGTAVPGQSIFGAGIPSGTVIQYVSGTTIGINNATSAVLSSTPVVFTITTGLP